MHGLFVFMSFLVTKSGQDNCGSSNLTPSLVRTVTKPAINFLKFPLRILDIYRAILCVFTHKYVQRCYCQTKVQRMGSPVKNRVVSG